MLCKQKAAGSSPAISIFPAVSGELAAMAIVDRSSDETVIESSPRSPGPALRVRSSSPLDPEEVTR